MNTTTSTEASAIEQIVEWSTSAPTWQRDALRRLVEKGSLDPGDIDALTALCRSDPGVDATPIECGHIRDAAASTKTVYLQAVRDVRHVNALAEGERLTFDRIGVTMIYGDNGAGKSGYARVLKKACR